MRCGKEATRRAEFDSLDRAPTVGSRGALPEPSITTFERWPGGGRDKARDEDVQGNRRASPQVDEALVANEGEGAAHQMLKPIK
jgi:hypothetical protein